MNEIDALLGIGLGQEDSAEKMRSLAHQLRGQQELGQVYSMSPTLAPQGRNMVTDARGDATRVGGLNRAMNRDRMQDDYRTEQNRLRELDIEADAQDTSSSGGWRKYEIPGSDEQAFIHPVSRKIFVPRTGQTYDSVEDLIAKGIDYRAEGAGREQEAKTREKVTEEEVQTRIEELVTTNSSLSNARGNFDVITNALDSGAFSGPAWAMTPTLRESTKQLETAVAGLTLDALTRYKLTPVSDKDIQYLKDSQFPNLYGESLRKWATHKKEAFGRMSEANKFMEDYLRVNRGIPTGDERKRVESIVDDILHSDGFEFAFDIDAEPNKAENTKAQPGVSNGVTTLSDGTRWDVNGNQVQ